MLKLLRRFRKSKDGLAAIEFAFIAPVLGTLLMGSIEMCNALSCHQKVTMLASTAADLVAQTTTVSSSDMTNVFNAVTAIVYPFPAGATKIVISSVVSDGSGNGKVAWSRSQNATALTVNSAVTVPPGLMTAAACPAGACSVILAQVTYNYTSPVGKFIVGTVAMSDLFYARPRKSATVSYTG